MRVALVATTIAALVLVGTSAAGWSGSGSGSVATAATTIGAGNTPSASAPTLSTNVTVSWTASSFGNGAQVSGYIVRRFNSITGVAAAVGPACSGVVTSLACTESGVTPGSWTYSITPAAGSWRGTESARSAALTVPGL